MRAYSELITLPTFKERFEYLRLKGEVGRDTFGFDRYLNQAFYRSLEWKAIRNQVIIRDENCDLGLPGNDIYGQVIVHHMNPIMLKDLKDEELSKLILDPEYLICTTLDTHNAIHYGGEPKALHSDPIVRTANDTKLW